MSRRTDRLHHADAHVELCRGSDVADVERVDEYGDYVHHSRCAGMLERSQHRFVSFMQLPERTSTKRKFMYHVCDILHVALPADANTQLPRRPNRHVDADAHLKLSCRRNISNVGRVGGHGEYLYDVHRTVVYHPMGNNGHARELCDRQPHFVRRIRQLMRERATHLHQRLTERIVYECFVYATDPNYANKFGFVSESHGLNPAGK